VIGKHFLCFASDVPKAKRLIDAREPRGAAFRAFAVARDRSSQKR
jgi:hypothetical protein